MIGSGTGARPSLLLFDLGGVLLETTTFTSLKRLLGARSPGKLEIPEIKERWLASQAVRQFELGAISPDRFALDFVAEWQLELTPAALLEEFAAWPTGFYPGVAETLLELRKVYRVGCLSNSNEIHWGKFDRFAGVFDLPLASHLLGVIKPDHSAFEAALRAAEVTAAEVVFFDDAPANVRAAEEVGMRAVLVDGWRATREALHTTGLLPHPG